MDVPPSPDRVFDFLAAEPEPHLTYDFFAVEPIPGLAEAPGKMNGWMEEDGPLGADLMESVVDPVIDDMMEPMKNPDEDVDMLMDDDDGDDDDEGEDDEDGWEVGGPSTAAPGPLFPVGRPFPEVVNSVAVHHEEIGGLCVRIENLKHAHGVLVRKIGDEQAMTKVGEVEDRVLDMQDKVNNYPYVRVDGLREDVDGLLGLNDRVQTLESTVQKLRKENQKLRVIECKR
ncbi:hypothetical protein Tco_0920923 [Tanacetum coccineum]